MEALTTWTKLNDVLRDADEATCRKLVEAEMKGEKRVQYVLRIHSRINKVRAARERLELKKRCGT